MRESDRYINRLADCGSLVQRRGKHLHPRVCMIIALVGGTRDRLACGLKMSRTCCRGRHPALPDVWCRRGSPPPSAVRDRFDAAAAALIPPPCRWPFNARTAAGVGADSGNDGRSALMAALDFILYQSVKPSTCLRTFPLGHSRGVRRALPVARNRSNAASTWLKKRGGRKP